MSASAQYIEQPEYSKPPQQLVVTDPEQQRETADLLTRYEDKLCRLITYNSFEYDCEALGQHFVVGGVGRHRCSFELTMGSLHYGEVIVTRDSPFRKSEIKALESCLSDLFRILRDKNEPLENFEMYERASA
jgi:hypothetical protein